MGRPIEGNWRTDRRRAAGRYERFSELMDERLARLRAMTQAGLVSLTEARINLGTANWRERWAYRLPRALGWLSRSAARDRLRVNPELEEG